ncbi:hypothetical protein ACL07V_37480 [Streptomyces sp. MB22_4]|uniref:hypothetical protein n=1 Tax=Streptomyces sp. MB22_4 TaxID=3383120 RepID=UPI0039A34909
MNKARLKYELLDHAHWATVGITLIGTFISLDTLLHHSRSPIPVLTTTIVAIGAASLVNTILNLTLADRRAHLYTAAETTTEGTDPR